MSLLWPLTIKVATHSYHHNAYFMQQASVVVRQTDQSQFVKLMELVFQWQDSRCPAIYCLSLHLPTLAVFLAGAVNMTEPQVQRAIADLISQNLDVAYDRLTTSHFLTLL